MRTSISSAQADAQLKAVDQIKSSATAGDPEAEAYLRASEKKFIVDTVQQAAWAEKKWVWVEHKEEGYVQAYIVAEDGDNVTIEYSENNTYSGLFLVTINPYKRLPIYSDKVVLMYKNKRRLEMPPHIYAISDAAYHDMLQDRENQSILITGESGAGKTENTKKVIQYLTSIASAAENLPAGAAATSSKESLEAQILQANPILESFGNAQTVRNNNSSRFGKFIRIEFNGTGHISSANIERYLLEKSRVTHQTAKERNYHIFYQLMKGANAELKQKLLLDGQMNDYTFIKNSNKNIDGVDDIADFQSVIESMNVMKISAEEQYEFFRCISAVLHLGNFSYTADREDQAQLTEKAQVSVEKVCHLLGIPVAEFSKGLLKPRVKAGREWVVQARNPAQVQYSVESLARALYERMFGRLVDRINESMDKPTSKATFIGVLDIAGFEIFEVNSFEQLCINYTNERLQQFFNHHMFILEQEEYKKEGIEWKFIDFGLDLQPTIDLIEKSNPIGILSCLDEDCVMPKATDKSFTEKLTGMWKGKSSKFDVPRFGEGFILHHYASQVEYKTAGWLDKNKDPLNENITKLLAHSNEKWISHLFQEYAADEDESSGAAAAARRVVSTVKKGAFRTVAQRHREQLNSLMNQLYSTSPHFVRCIIPNEEKKPGKIDANLVLDQLRCNGVLEGIRICRQGFPSRLVFSEFRQRYEILAPGLIPKGFMDGRKAAQTLLETLQIDQNQFRIGSSKVFFRAGVLAELEERRDAKLSDIVSGFQAFCRGHLGRRKFKKRLDQLKAIRIIQRNARIYVGLREWAWWKLYTKVKPLLNVSRTEDELRLKEDQIRQLEDRQRQESEERERLQEQARQLEEERRKLEELLISEKNAASDQREILERTQKRQVDLEDELKMITAAFEQSDAANEELKQIKKRMEQQLKEQTEKLIQEKAASDRLEKEKSQRESQLLKIQTDLNSGQSAQDSLQQQLKQLEQRVQQLQKELSDSADREQDLQRQRGKLQQQVAELEEASRREEEEKVELAKKKAALENDLRLTRDQLQQEQRMRQEAEQQRNKKDQEAQQFQQRLKQEQQDREQLDKQKRELQIKSDAVAQELEAQKAEKERLVRQRKKVEDELAELRQLVEAKGDQESKLTEVQRQREQELDQLRHQLESQQQETEEVRRRQQQQLDQVRQQLEQQRADKSNADRHRSQLEAQLNQMTEDQQKLDVDRQKLDRQRRQQDQELQQLRARLQDDDRQLQEMRQAREQAELKLQQQQIQLDELSELQGRQERERLQFEAQSRQLQDELQETQRRLQSADLQRRKVTEELAELQQRVDDDELQKLDMQRQLQSKSGELDTLRDRVSREQQSRIQDLERGKQKAERDLSDLQQRLSELDQQAAQSEKAKQRLQLECDDLRVQTERQQQQLKAQERQSKQWQQELQTTHTQLEQERRSREQFESQMRRLQSTVEAQTVELEERQQSFAALQRTKETLEQELRAVGGGAGGNEGPEVEKLRRRLEQQCEELKVQLEEEEASRQAAEDAKRRADEQLSEVRQKMERELFAKDSQIEETRRMLLREVNSLGDQLSQEQMAKNELLKQKKRVEQELADIQQSADRQSRDKSELARERKRADLQQRDLQAKLDEERRQRQNYEELAGRQEKKANLAQTELERLQQLQEQTDRQRKLLERQTEELAAELQSTESQRQQLHEAKRRLEEEQERLLQQLEQEELAALKQPQQEAPSASTTAAVAELEAKIERIEESRRALQGQLRVAQVELDDLKSQLLTADGARKSLQSECDDLRSRVEQEVQQRSEESSNRRRLATELKELQLRLESEIARATDLQESVQQYKQKYDESIGKLESAEIARQRAEKSEAAARVQIREIEESIAELLKEKVEHEQRAKSFEAQFLDLQERHTDETLELTDLRQLRERLQSELQEERDRARKSYDEHEAELENVRKRFQREVKQLSDDLDHEKAAGQQLKESTRSHQSELDTLHARLEEETRLSGNWKRDKERLELRLQDLSRLYQDAAANQEQYQAQSNQLLSQLRELRLQLDESDTQRQMLEKSKRQLEVRLEETNEQLTESTAAKTSAQLQLSTVEQELRELRQRTDEEHEQLQQATDRAHKADSMLQQVQSEVQRSRDLITDLERGKFAAEKQSKELQLQLLELQQSTGSGGDSSSFKRLESKLTDLSSQLDRVTREKDDLLSGSRKSERLVRDLQQQLLDKERQRQRSDEDAIKTSDKLKKMKVEMQELETREAQIQLSRRRAEREAEEFKERSQRLEKDVEKLKIRLDRIQPTAASS